MINGKKYYLLWIILWIVFSFLFNNKVLAVDSDIMDSQSSLSVFNDWKWICSYDLNTADNNTASYCQLKFSNATWLPCFWFISDTWDSYDLSWFWYHNKDSWAQVWSVKLYWSDDVSPDCNSWSWTEIEYITWMTQWSNALVDYEFTKDTVWYKNFKYEVLTGDHDVTSAYEVYFYWTVHSWWSPNTAPVWENFTDSWWWTWGTINMASHISDSEESDNEIDMYFWTASGVTSLSYNTWTTTLTWSTVSDFVWTWTLVYELNDWTITSTWWYVITFSWLDNSTPNEAPSCSDTITNNAWTWWLIDLHPHISDSSTTDSNLWITFTDYNWINLPTYNTQYISYAASETWTWNIIYTVDDWELSETWCTIDINWLVYIPPTPTWSWSWFDFNEECSETYSWLCDTQTWCTAIWWYWEIWSTTWTTACRDYENECSPISEDWTWSNLTLQQQYNELCLSWYDQWYEIYLHSKRDNLLRLHNKTYFEYIYEMIFQYNTLIIPLLLLQC